MHDIDRTRLEMEWESGSYEYEGDGETGGEYEIYGGASDELYGELYDEAAVTHGLFTEMDEMELAAEMLEVTDEAELDQFLGKLLSKAGRAAGGILRTPEGSALGGVLKGIARQSLPGRQLTSVADRLFGLELEGMSAEDQEFEVARRFVRLAGDAVQNVLHDTSPKMPLVRVVQKAVAAAARQHAPGLLKLVVAAPRTPGHNGRQHPQRRHAEADKSEHTEAEPEAAGPFSEAEEMELAAELLEVTDEAELEQFLGKLFKKAAGVFRGVAKKALPFVGGALGSLIPIPGIGTAVGSSLGDAVGNALEMEFGELNAEDQEFETARRIVRVAGSAAQKIAEASPDADPQAVARKAVKAAVRQHIPGLVSHIVADQQEGRHGRWERRGRTIVLLDV